MEPQYAGARIEGDVVTLDFVKKMLDDFKNQKNLHKRYVSFEWCNLLFIFETLLIFQHLLYFDRYAYQIVLQTREMLRALPSLVDIVVPEGKHFTVCGDVHGQVMIS